MRAFRAMSLSTLVMLAVAGVISWHVSFWILDPWSLQGSVFATLFVFAGLGVVGATVTIIVTIDEGDHFGTQKFIDELLTNYAAIAVFCTAMLLLFGWMAFDLFESAEDRPFDGTQFLSMVIGFLAAYTVSFFGLVLIHGSDAWTGENSGELHDISDRRRAG